MASPIRNQEQAFLADICEHLEDDTPRLIYADWLEEHGDEECAAFIRVGVQSRCPVPAREAPAKVRQRWLEPLTNIPGEWTFQRGFLEEVSLTADVFLRQAAELFRTLPLQRLHLGEVHGRMPELATIKQLGRLTELDLSGNEDINDEDVGILTTQADLGRVRTLGLSLNAITPAGVRYLATATRLGRLQHLQLGDNVVGDEGVQALAGAAHLCELHILGLGVDPHSDYHTRIHARGANALAAAPYLKQLRNLDLSYNPIGDAGLVSLACSENVRLLQVLDLAATEIGDTGEAGIEALVESPFLGELRRLVLSGNSLNTLMVSALAYWPGLAQLERLELSFCQLRASAGRALASSPYLENISRLNLRGHSFDADTVILMREHFGNRVLLD